MIPGANWGQMECLWSRWKPHPVAITQPIDTTTSTGKLQLAILAAVAEFERDLIVERTKEGMARAKAEGKRIGRPPGKKDSKPRRVNGYYARYHHRPAQYNSAP